MTKSSWMVPGHASRLLRKHSTAADGLCSCSQGSYIHGPSISFPKRFYWEGQFAIQVTTGKGESTLQHPSVRRSPFGPQLPQARMEQTKTEQGGYCKS